MFERINVSEANVRASHGDERSTQIVRQRRAQIHHLSAGRMSKHQPRCVKEVPSRAKTDEPPPSTTTVRIVTDHRMSNRSEMDTNLVSTPAMQVRS